MPLPWFHAVLKLLCLLASQRCLAYEHSMARSLAYLEKAVYCGREKFQKWDVGDSVTMAPKVNASQLRFVQSSEQAAAGIGRLIEPDGCFVAIRGTFGPISSLLDAVFWLMDFEHVLGCPSCQVVAGFYLAYLSIRDQIFHALAEFQCHQRPLYLVGHSQGAASLSYFLFDALMRKYTVQHMYALESPRPGNENFAEKLRALVGAADAWRVTHYQDLVPHLPPPGVFGYVHALPEIYYDTRNGTHYLECGVEDKNCSGRWWAWQLNTVDHDSFAQIYLCKCALPEARPESIWPPVAFLGSTSWVQTSMSTTFKERLMLLFG